MLLFQEEARPSLQWIYNFIQVHAEYEEIKKNFIFRLGELHIAFAFLKVIGNYI